MKSQFFILAGPNGAGKSTHGHFHIPEGLPVFNGDLVFAELQKKYPHIEPEQLGGGVAVALESARDIAIAARSDFAFESNFSNNLAVDITRMFKEAGYETSLIYFGLPQVDYSRQRVTLRVAFGGHDVKPEVIRFNYDEGIKLVNAHLADFDHIRFIDTSIPHSARVIAFANKVTGQHQVIDNSRWFNDHFKNAFERDFMQFLSNRPSPGLER